jgi:Phage capsid protein
MGKAADVHPNSDGIAMSENLPKLFTTQFSSLLKIKLAQETSMLRGRVMEGFHVGKQASPVQYVGPVQAKTPQGRFAPLVPAAEDFTRRWVVPVDKDVGPSMIDNFDKLKTAIDPTSEYSAVHAQAVAREWDDRIIASAFASANLGDGNGGSTFTAETFNTGSTVTGAGFQIPATFGSTAASGLTVAKMIEAKRAFRKLQVPQSEAKTWITNSQGEADLLNQVQVTSNEFNTNPVMNDGVVTRFLGFDIVYSERLSSDGTTRKNIPLVKSGAYLGIWKDNETNIDRAVWLSSQPYQIYTMMSSGATRLEPGRLLQCLCADSSAAADVTP